MGDNKIKIMVLDDEPIVGERLQVSLERAGYAVDAFLSSPDALEGLHKECYDILITDLKMNGPDGIEVLKMAKKLCPTIKAIVITGFATRETAEIARQSGAVEFIAKPFKMSQLKSLVATIIEKDDKID